MKKWIVSTIRLEKGWEGCFNKQLSESIAVISVTLRGSMQWFFDTLKCWGLELTEEHAVR